MIFTKQIRLLFLLPLFFSSLIIILVAFVPWINETFLWIDQIEAFLTDTKKQSFYLQSYAYSFNAQTEYESIFIDQIALQNVYYGIKTNQIKLNPLFQPTPINGLNSSANQNLPKDSQGQNLPYFTTWYNPNTTDLQSIPQSDIDVFSYMSFLSNSLLVTNYSEIKRSVIFQTFEEDGTATSVPAMFYPEQPKGLQRENFEGNFKNCSYSNNPRNYFYEFRCSPWFQNALNISTTDIYYNKPSISMVSGKPGLSNTICSKLVDPNTKQFSSVLCQQYQALIEVNYSLASHNDLRSYVVFQGTRLPMIYPKEVKELKNVEDLEYGANDYFDEKYEYYEKSRLFEESYGSQQTNCTGSDILKQSKNFTISKDRQDYFIIARNVSVCQAVQTESGDEVYNEYILGTIVTEISMILDITGNISRIIQLSLSGSAILLIIIVAALNHYSIKLAEQLAEPIDDLIHQLRSIDDDNIEIYFSELLQGEKAKETPYEMGLLIRSVYDFVGIVKLANEAFKQGNDSQAIIGYAVANQFYLENGNLLGAGMIQNNMGAIHVRNKRYAEATNSFIDSIMCIENEWERYKTKYLKHGVNEQELQVDSEFQKLSTIVLNRCYNLCECLSQFLMTEMLQLEEIIFSNKMESQLSMLRDSEKRRIRGESEQSLEKMIYAQMHMNVLSKPSQKQQSEQIDIIEGLNEEGERVVDVVDPKHKQLILGYIEQLIRLNGLLDPFRMRFVKNHSVAYQAYEIDEVELQDIQGLIQQLWRDTITTYQYCKYIMENPLQMQRQTQKRLYIYLKIIIGYLYLGEVEECDSLVDQAEKLLQEAKEQVNEDEEFQYPVSVLEQKFYLYQGLILYKRGLYRKSSEEISRSLFLEGQFSPRDRMEGLIILKSILKAQNLECGMVEDCLSRYQPIAKDVVFMVDMGKKMAKARAIIKAIKTIGVLFRNVLGENDRMSYGTVRGNLLNCLQFFQEYQELVPLMGKAQNEPFIEQILRYVPLPQNGNSDITNGLSGVIQKLINSSHTNVQKNMKEYYLKKDGFANIRYRRFIIVLSDEFTQDNQGNLQIDEAMVRQLQENGLELIVIQYDEDTENLQWKSASCIKFYHDSNIDALLNYFSTLEERIEVAGSNYYLEQTL